MFCGQLFKPISETSEKSKAGKGVSTSISLKTVEHKWTPWEMWSMVQLTMTKMLSMLPSHQASPISNRNSENLSKLKDFIEFRGIDGV